MIVKIFFSFLFVVLSNFVLAQDKFDSVAVQKFQKNLNREFSDAKNSPLPAEDLAVFKSLAFFPINKKFFITAKFVRTLAEKPFKMKTSTDRKPIYLKYGEAQFTIDGKSYRLNIYQNVELSRNPAYKNYLFLPYSDATSGKESYIGGRYIDLKIPIGGTIVIDFNQSYNPLCAYNHQFSCPIVPLDNDLNVEIKAGVKKFH